MFNEEKFAKLVETGIKKKKPTNNLMEILARGSDDFETGEPLKLLIKVLVPYKEHPFRLYEGERLNDMVRSIKELGVLLPVIVRPLPDDEDSYEILSGHNRVNAAKLAGLREVPAIVKHDLSDEEAQLIVTETNLIQRSFEDLLPSEKAVTLKMHMDAIKSQGKRTT